LIASARWLTTDQIRRRFFPSATIDAVRKRLRILSSGRYLCRVQPSRMHWAYWTLGSEGKRVLERTGVENLVIHRDLPKQLEHFTAINDVRIATELSVTLSYFFACWELQKTGWSELIIPDALFSFEGRTFAVEFDTGSESTRLFAKTKMPAYRSGLGGLILSGVLIISDRESRLDSLANSIGSCDGLTVYTMIDQLRDQGLRAPIFWTGAPILGIKGTQDSLLELSFGGDRSSRGLALYSNSL
jgi:hypothetical protein